MNENREQHTHSLQGLGYLCGSTDNGPYAMNELKDWKQATYILHKERLSKSRRI